MFALVGVLVSCAALGGTAPAVGFEAADGLCALVTEACHVPARQVIPAVEYATPVDVDCPAVLTITALASTRTAELPPVVGDCSPPSIDFRYRVSRSPESERPTGALRPQRAHRNHAPTATWNGLPPRGGILVVVNPVQPVALYELPGLIPPDAVSTALEHRAHGAVRSIAPLDRPPRA